MSRKTLIRGGTVLTLGARTPNFTEADVLIEDDRVVEVAPGIRARDAEVVDASDAIVMPGFIDTHRHVWKSLFRNFGVMSDGASNSAARYGPHYQPDDAYAATLIGLLGAVAAGITTVVDWSDIQIDEAYTEAVLQAHADAGLRTVFVHASPPWTDSHDNRTQAIRHLVESRPVTPGSLTTYAIGPPESDPSRLEQIEVDWALARALGLRIHVHAGTLKSATGTIASMSGKGMLGEDVTLIHCSNLDDKDLTAIASSGARVSLTPAAEMAEGFGSPPIQQLIDHSIRPGLGVDNEQLVPGDIFAQMRALISVQHATLFDLKLAGKAGIPNLMSTRDVIRHATIDGARVSGLGEVTGSLEPGKQADIVVLRTDRPNIYPINDPIGAVVWGMDTSNIDWVFVAGRALVRSGALEGNMDRARDLAISARDRVASAAGLEVGVNQDAPQ